jgi:predicted RNA-binding Zn-ribbon protein involved in translation (DUF1610 family)
MIKSKHDKIVHLSCEACGREIECTAGNWECPFCGHDNVRGHTQGVWFQAYCTERSQGSDKAEARKTANEQTLRRE